ncbi:hypothetical protein ElyMa_006088200 [Elysia marginata]|uniref:Senescence domain-containing protein n=1 Tax=Elysia marginata TaxID=1093978 RepID=A0AAV4GQQ9_9GAST|nr:hypothetical protein ElyMa_006088200 [Elysia marginata]
MSQRDLKRPLKSSSSSHSADATFASPQRKPSSNIDQRDSILKQSQSSSQSADPTATSPQRKASSNTDGSDSILKQSQSSSQSADADATAKPPQRKGNSNTDQRDAIRKQSQSSSQSDATVKPPQRKRNSNTDQRESILKHSQSSSQSTDATSTSPQREASSNTDQRDSILKQSQSSSQSADEDATAKPPQRKGNSNADQRDAIRKQSQSSSQSDAMAASPQRKASSNTEQRDSILEHSQSLSQSADADATAKPPQRKASSNTDQRDSILKQSQSSSQSTKATATSPQRKGSSNIDQRDSKLKQSQSSSPSADATAKPPQRKASSNTDQRDSILKQSQPSSQFADADATAKPPQRKVNSNTDQRNAILKESQSSSQSADATATSPQRKASSNIDQRDSTLKQSQSSSQSTDATATSPQRKGSSNTDQRDSILKQSQSSSQSADATATSPQRKASSNTDQRDSILKQLQSSSQSADATAKPPQRKASSNTDQRDSIRKPSQSSSQSADVSRHEEENSYTDPRDSIPSTSTDIRLSETCTSPSEVSLASGSVLKSSIDSDVESSIGPIIKLKKKTSHKGAASAPKSISFVDVTGSDVEDSVAHNTRLNASKHVRAFKIFTIEDSVQIFFIGSGGSVETQEDTWSLHIVRLTKKTNAKLSDEVAKEHIQPAAFLHVGNWLYPLFPSCSPVLITAFGTYLFPDLRSNKEDLVSSLISQVTSLWWEDDVGDEIHDLNQPPSSVVLGIKYVAETIVWVITLLTQYYVWIIRYLASLIRSRGSQASEQYHVDPNLLQGILYAKSATGQGVILTSFFVEQIHEETMNLSRLLTPQASLTLPSTIKQSALSSVFKLTMEVGVTTYGGVNDIYKSLQDASTLLIEAFSEETIKTMEHKYGEEYGNLTKEAFGAALNVREALTNTQKITSLAFVPHTINSRIRERLGSFSEDERVAVEDHDHHKDEHSTSKVTKKKSKTHKGRSKGPSPSGSQEELTERHTPTHKIQQQRHGKKPQWNWSSSNLVAQTNLEVQLRESESDGNTVLSPKKSREFSKHSISHEVLPEEPLETQSVDAFNPLAGRSSDSFESVHETNSAQEAKPSVNGTMSSTSHTSIGRRPSSTTHTPVGRMMSSTSHASIGSRMSSSSYGSFKNNFRSPSSRTGLGRRSSSALTVQPLSRRQSVFLSPTRQSMHVIAAMANVVERQFSDPESTPGLGACSREAHHNLFMEAAISITRAKIRRLHREKADEKFLVVVKLTSKVLQATKTNSAIL